MVPAPMGAPAQPAPVPIALVSWANFLNFNFGAQDFCFDFKKKLPHMSLWALIFVMVLNEY